MLCEHAHDYLLDHIDNELPAVLQQELDEHLRGCADCREELEALRKTSLLLQLRAVPEPRLTGSRMRVMPSTASSASAVPSVDPSSTTTSS